MIDERELRSFFHGSYDHLAPPRDPYRLVREAGDRPAGTLRGIAAGVAAGLVGVIVAVGVLLMRDLHSAIPAPMAFQPSPAPTATAYTPQAVALTASAASEFPTPRVAALSNSVALISVGDSIIRVSDNGRTWLKAYPGLSNHSGNVRDLEWVTRDTAFATTNYGLLRSDDAGTSWRLVAARTDLRRLDFVSRTEGYLVAGSDGRQGDWHLLRTTDGGAHFTSYAVGLIPVTWIQWVSDSQAWAAGPSGVVTTSDGGGHWRSELNVGKSLYGDAQVGFVDADHGYAYLHGTDSGRIGSVVYQTADGGQSWQGLGEPDTLAGFQDDQMVVTGASSAEIVTRSASGGVVRCTAPATGGSWKCFPIDVAAQGGAGGPGPPGQWPPGGTPPSGQPGIREAASGSGRLLAAVSGGHVLVAGSADGGTTWWSVELDASAWTRD